MWPEYAGTSKNLQILWNRPFHSIFNFWHGQVRENPSTLKKCLEINKTAKFEIDLLKVNEETAPQSLKNLQTFVWWGHKLTPRHTNICKFSELCGAIPLLAKDVITFKFGNNFTNIRASDISRGRRPAKFRYFREIPRNSQKNAKYREIHQKYGQIHVGKTYLILILAIRLVLFTPNVQI